MTRRRARAHAPAGQPRAAAADGARARARARPRPRVRDERRPSPPLTSSSPSLAPSRKVRGTMRVPHLQPPQANLAALLSKLVLLQEARRAQSPVRAMLGAEDFLGARRRRARRGRRGLAAERGARAAPHGGPARRVREARAQVHGHAVGRARALVGRRRARRARRRRLRGGRARGQGGRRHGRRGRPRPRSRRAARSTPTRRSRG